MNDIHTEQRQSEAEEEGIKTKARKKFKGLLFDVNTLQTPGSN